MTFNEANTVEQMVIDACQGPGWQFVPGPQLPRQAADVTPESQSRDALIRPGPEIAAQPDRADLYCEPLALASGVSGTTLSADGGGQRATPDATACGSRVLPTAWAFGAGQGELSRHCRNNSVTSKVALGT